MTILRIPGVYAKLLVSKAYQGALQHVRQPDERKKLVGDVVKKAKDCIQALEASGIKCRLVTGGGSGTYKLEAGSGVFNEIQPGLICNCSCFHIQGALAYN